MNEYSYKTLNSTDDCKALVDEFLMIYSSVLQGANKFVFATDIEEKSVVVLRMIYAKTLAIRKLLDGIAYNYIDEKSTKTIVEPTTLFVIVRNILELVYVYEYVFLMPDSPEKKEFAYYLYMHTGLKERLAFCEDPDKTENEQIIKTVLKMNEAAQKLTESEYYRGLTSQSQKLLRKNMNSRHPSYRFVFKENEIEAVNYEEACAGIGMVGTFFKNVYAYLSTHAHPTYLSLVQFKEAYIGEKPLHDGFAELATTLLSSILSVLLDDARREMQYVESVYEGLGPDLKGKVRYYVQLTRVAEENHS